MILIGLRTYTLTHNRAPSVPKVTVIRPKSVPKPIKNYLIPQHAKSHSDRVFTVREAHWPIRGRSPRPYKTVTIKTTTWPPKCRIVSKRVPKWRPKWLLESVKIHMAPNMIPNFPKCSQTAAQWPPNDLKMALKWSPNRSKLAPLTDPVTVQSAESDRLEETSNARHHKQTHRPTNPRRRNNWLLINARK